jgi:hypothetical protein
LSGADLYGANLRGAAGVIQINWESYTILFHAKGITIGCQHKTYKEWMKLTLPKVAKQFSLPKSRLKQFKILLIAGHKVFKQLQKEKQ